MPLKWRGRKVAASAAAASIDGVNATMQACALHAKDNHGAGAHALGRFESQTGEAERSIRITTPARKSRRGVAGRWGSIGINYFRRLELGFQGQDSAGRTVNASAYPSLFPAADAEYPKLGRRIRRAYRRRAV